MEDAAATAKSPGEAVAAAGEQTALAADQQGPPPDEPQKDKQAEKPKVEKRLIKYRILRKGDPTLDENSKTLTLIGDQEAANADDAVTTYAEANSLVGGDFVAVPVRYWTDVPIAAETQTRIVVKRG